MPNAKSLLTSPTPSFLIVGDGGTGKTRFLATCPRAFVIDTDNGMASVAGQDVEYRTFKDAPYGSKATNPDLGIYPWGTAWDQFVKEINRIGELMDKGEFPYDTLGVDSITTLSNISMNYVLKSAGKIGNAAPEIQHWGQQLRLLETVMDQLTSWPIRLVVTAHIKRDDNLVMGTKEYLPLVAGQLSGKIGIYFDEVYFTDVKGLGRDRKVVFVTESQAMYKQAKTRHNVPSGVEANWSAVEKAMGGGA